MTSSATARVDNEGEEDPIVFVIVPKVFDPFYESVHQGCQAAARELSLSSATSSNDSISSKPARPVECHYIGHPHAIAADQALILRQLVTNFTLYNLTRPPDGISVAVLDEEITGAAIDFVMEQQQQAIAVITFDADAPASKRLAFVSTDNYAFGQELGKILLQLHPDGGTFGMITGEGPNLHDRIQGVRDRLLNDPLNPTRWREVSHSPLNCRNNISLSVQQMFEYALSPVDEGNATITAIVPVGGWPMFDPDGWKQFVDAYPDIITIVGDSVDVQLDLIQQGYVHGLVGQLPYQMGKYSASTLFDILTKSSGQAAVPPPASGRRQMRPLVVVEQPLTVTPADRYAATTTAYTNTTTLQQTVFGTHMLQILRVPIELPPVEVDFNTIGNLRYLGYSMFAVIAASSFFAIGWVYRHRHTHIVRASQPVFLYMIGIGTLILGSAILPLTVDDGISREGYSHAAADMACMFFPWLLSTGFTTAFAALFSKTWRIFRLMSAAQRFQRVTVTVRDVMAPFVILLAANVITLTCWTILSPLEYVRSPSEGTDAWNRATSSYGRCTTSSTSSISVVPFVAILVCTNVGVLIVANIYAYRSRHITTEYAESRYIALVNGSMLEAAMIGMPVISLVYHQPRAYFVVWSLFIFVICMAIVSFIFSPKCASLKEWNDAQQKKREANEKTFNNGGDSRRSSKTNEAQQKDEIDQAPSLEVGTTMQHISTESDATNDNDMPMGSMRVADTGKRPSIFLGEAETAYLLIASRTKSRGLKKELHAMPMDEKRKLIQFYTAVSQLDDLDRLELVMEMEELIVDNDQSDMKNNFHSTRTI